jgi:PKD repeat protein
MRKFAALALASFVALLGAAACTVHSTDTPSLTGPSTYALSVAVAATPDTINQDGGSQSSIMVVARDGSGKPVSGQTFTMNIDVNSAAASAPVTLVPEDFGTLSARTIVTGSDGTAHVVYTAPPPVQGQINTATCGTSVTGNLPGQCVYIVAVPTGSNAQTAQAQMANIRLVPPGVILPPASTPFASFNVSPSSVSLNVPAFFDASASCAAPLVNGACNAAAATPPATITQYAWTFGDGATANTKTASHTYTGVGSFSVTLTVTNSGGLAASTTQQVSVTASTAPTVSFVASQTAPIVGQTVYFNGVASQAAPGHSIVQWAWDFGDGQGVTGASLFSTSHTYTAGGSFTVVLTVRDDTGQTSSQSTVLNVGTGVPVVVLVLSKAGGVTVTADASSSTAFSPSTIADYTFIWGDGTQTDAGLSPTATHAEVNGAGTYTVTVRVTDSTGRIGFGSQPITVP